MEKEKQGICPKCGRNYILLNIGNFDKPLYVIPSHTVLKGNGSKHVVLCKGTHKEPE